MTDPNKIVTPIQQVVDGLVAPVGGITIREHFALELAKVMIASDRSDTPLRDSVEYADVLIERLNRKNEKI